MGQRQAENGVRWSRLITLPIRWLDSWSELDKPVNATCDANDHRIEYLRVLPFLIIHPACLAVYWVGYSSVAIGIALMLYVIRMFAITAFYHRFLSHKAFKTSRFMQLLFSMIAVSSGQKGPLWWASYHRLHHQHSDQPEDIHSPQQQGFWWSHIGWLMAHGNDRSRLNMVKDLRRYPELVLLDRFHIFIPALLATGLYLGGEWLNVYNPQLQTSGWQLVIWGFCISTVLLFHATACINSLAHRYGTQIYETGDNSRNNVWLAIFTLGEGWHNNHHFCPNSARQGFQWYQLDLTWYGLKVMAWMGLIWDLKPVRNDINV